jgi:hypothetical protein
VQATVAWRFLTEMTTPNPEALTSASVQVVPHREVLPPWEKVTSAVV